MPFSLRSLQLSIPVSSGFLIFIFFTTYGTLQLSSHVFKTFEDLLSRNAENKSGKSKQCVAQFSRFWEAEIMIFGGQN